MSPDQKKKTTLIVAGSAMTAFGVGLLTYTNWPEKKYSANLSYFSEDDGKTFYVDGKENIPPYTHAGHEAVGVAMYRTEKNSQPFCGYLFRFPANLKRQLDGVEPTKRISQAYGSEMNLRLEVNSPKGSGKWVPINTTAGESEMVVKSPDGTELDRVIP